MIHPFNAKKTADNLLEDWHDICTSLNIPHFLLFGTCLGFHREQGYIKDDNDLDVGVLCDSQRLGMLVVALRGKGIVDSGRLVDNINFMRYGVMLDVWHKIGPLHHKYLEKFDTIIHEGVEYNMPSPVEDYLEFVYDDWRTPAKGEFKNNVWINKGYLRSYVNVKGGLRLL